MSERDELEQVFQRIRELVSGAYAQGSADAMERVRALLSENSVGFAPSERREISHIAGLAGDDRVGRDLAPTRQRAPRGSVREVVRRALTERPEGMTVAEMLKCRRGPLEEMIAASSIRAELRKGADSGTYEEDNGRWRFSAAQNESGGVQP